MPTAAGLNEFLVRMDAVPHQRLHHALAVCLKGSETSADIELVAWASACTGDQTQARARDAGVLCEPHDLFSMGMSLMDEGMNPSVALLRPKDHPEIIARMAQLASARRQLQGSCGSTGLEAGGQPGRRADDTAGQNRMTAEELGIDAFEAAASKPSAARALSDNAPAKSESASQRRPNPPQSQPPSVPDELKAWETLRLFGNTAAHTLEVSSHRRAGNFLGVGVVSIESARATKEGFDWSKKLTFQLTPEEMPEVIAVLLGIRQEATFNNHGTDRNKGLSFRNQDDGLQVVATWRGDIYPVPVKRPVMYYLLDLFCRAMAHGYPDRKASDVIALVRGIYS